MTADLSRRPGFDDDDLVDRLDDLSDEARDTLPFGTAKMTAAGVVIAYARRESELSGFAAAAALGRNWFVDVAPCMDTPALRAELLPERGRGPVDIAFEHTGDFRDPKAILRVRIMQTADLAHYWIAIERQ